MRDVSEVQRDYLDGLSEIYSSYKPTTGEGREAVADLLRLLTFAEELLQNRNEWQATAEAEEAKVVQLEKIIEQWAHIKELEKLLGI